MNDSSCISYQEHSGLDDIVGHSMMEAESFEQEGNYVDIDAEEHVIIKADLLVTKACERRKVLFFSNNGDLPHNLKNLLKQYPDIQETAADDFFNELLQKKKNEALLQNEKISDVLSNEKMATFHEAVHTLCGVSSRLNHSLESELEELRSSD